MKHALIARKSISRCSSQATRRTLSKRILRQSVIPSMSCILRMLPAKTLCNSILVTIVKLVKRAQVKFVNSQVYNLSKSISTKLIICITVNYVLSTNQFFFLSKSFTGGINTISIKRRIILIVSSASTRGSTMLMT